MVNVNIQMLQKFEPKKLGKAFQRGVSAIFCLAVLSYGGLCLFLFLRQQQIIINPATKILHRPSDEPYRLSYETVWLPIPNSSDKLHTWWIPAKRVQQGQQTTPKTLIYFSGRGTNKSYNLARIEGLWRLGFSILMIDYRGAGASPGPHPSEAQMYADAQVAWNYVTQTRKISPQQVILYGESLGGAVALDLAVKQPQAHGLILQSTFTSISDWARQNEWLQLLPINQLLTQRFDSQAKIASLRMPVLLLHGQKDAIVPMWMSQHLYNAAPTPKRLLIIPGKGHITIYQPGPQSYLTAIQQFFEL
jgi:uncharacterized protein